MKIIAKEITDNFWIIEENGERVGMLQKTEGGITLTRNKYQSSYKNLSQLKKQYPITFITNKKTKNKNNNTLYDFPCKSQPFNSIFDLQRKIPLYTKTEKSSSYYSAGYYIIKFGNGWVKAFNPKLITLQRYEFKGPYKTKEEMQQQLRFFRQNDTH